MQFKMKRSITNSLIQKRKGACSPSAASSGSQQYPYPSNPIALSFVSAELDGDHTYLRWKEQILCLLDVHDMRGFVDGTIKEPGGKNGLKRKVDKTKYMEWKRSDTLVKGWIFNSISDDVMETVVGLQTAYEVWNKIKTNYTTRPRPKNVVRQQALDVGMYVPLCRAIQVGDWEKAQEFFNKDKDALINKLNRQGQRTLHVVIGNPENVKFLENLLDQINPESLPTLVDNMGNTALHFAAMIGNTKAAEMLVQKNPNLLFIPCSHSLLPIHKAIHNSQKPTFLYLLQTCKQHIGLCQKDGYHNPFEVKWGILILGDALWTGFYEVAYELLKEYPEFATTIIPNHRPLLSCIANESCAFRSAKCYNFYQRFVYSHVPTKSQGLKDICKIPDVENQEANRVNVLTNCTKSYTVIKRICFKIREFAIIHVPHIKQLHEDKVKHNIALRLLKFICDEVFKLKSNHWQHYGSGFIDAVVNNTPEVIEMLTQTFPDSVWTKNRDGHSLSQLSIKNRCEHVYNFFVHEVTHEKYFHDAVIDKDGNNLLHLAGQLAPTHKLNMVSGAALQIQRELQWFQEVSRFIPPKKREAKNKRNETPIMVFRKEHEGLRQKGEAWMKSTANSYTITAALIITIAFAAAITIPGGNHGDTGRAIYRTRPSFIIFIVSDAISLFTSTTSLLLFLSILTARYAYDDFLYKLPKRLILGLVMLFMSVTTMLIAFSATLYIMYGQENSWIMIPIATITCLPIASFVTLQLPLLVDLTSSTYGRGIFCKRSDLRIIS